MGFFRLFITAAVVATTATATVLPRALGTCDNAFFDEAARQITADNTNFPGVTVKRIFVTDVTNGRFDPSVSDKDDTGYPTAIDLLPRLCAVRINVENTTDTAGGKSQYDLGLFLLPFDKWNWRILTVGNGGFLGGINWFDMSEGAHYGFSTVSTSTGHSAGQGNLTWAHNNITAQLDWAYRAMHGTAVLGKEFTRRYYDNRPPIRSYYAGCSTGGRQGLREIAYDADTFDGLLIGAPAWNTVDLMPWISHLANVLVKSGTYALYQAKLDKIAALVRSQCPTAGTDVVPDGIISDPDACLSKVDFTQLVCTSGQDPNRDGCFKDADQARTVQNAFYNDYTVASPSIGKPLVSHGYDPGSEDQWNIYFSFNETLNGFDMEYERNFLNDPNANVATYDDSVVTTSRNNKPGAADAYTPPFDLRRFRNRGGGRPGGKVMMYHGMADGFLPRKNTLQWYQDAKTASGISSDAEMGTFFRYFEVPGMQHCFLTPGLFAGQPVLAPWDFAQPGAASILRTPGVGYGLGWGNGGFNPGITNDSRYDAFAALVQWTEGGAAPAKIIAGNVRTDAANNRTRPICAYPARPSLTPGQNEKIHTSWTCA